MIVVGSPRSKVPSIKVLEVSGGIGRVVMDSSPAFKESEHPRDKDGKFATSAGGGGSSASGTGANVPAPLTNHLKAIVKNAGFKKAKGSGPTTYVHPSGVKIIVHPTPGKHHSSQWTVHGPGGQAAGSGTTLVGVLNKLVPKSTTSAQPAKTEAPSLVPKSNSASTEEVVQSLSVVGLNHKDTYTDDDGSKYEVFESGNAAVKYCVETGVWSYESTNENLTELDKEDGFGIEQGQGLTHLLALINGEEPEVQAAVQHVEKQEAAAFTLAEMSNTGSGKAITALGYTPAETEAGTTIYTKPNGAKIKYNSATTEWVAVTPGHMTKEGTGLPALEALMQGKIAPGVKNSNIAQHIYTKAELASVSEAQKKAEAQQAASAKLQAEQVKTMKELQGAAPQATAEEQSAISYYSGSNYTTINNELRHNPENAANNNKIKAIDAYLAKSVIPKDVTLYRKVSNEYAKILKSVIMEGCSFIDRGFISTSTHEESWSGSLKMIINVPAGSKGAAIKQYSQHKNENEVLLPRNSKMVVTAMDMKNNTIHVTLDQGHFGK